jgi:hypothetical protein
MAAICLLVLSLFVVTSSALAGGSSIEPRAPGGTPGPPDKGPTPTGTWLPGQLQGPPPFAGSDAQNTPGAQATAQAGGHGKPTVYRGTLSTVDGSGLTLVQADGSPVSLIIGPDTRIKVPGPNSQGDTLVVGMHVVAQSRLDANSNLVALSIMAIPGQPSLTHRVGTVTAYAPGSSISIQAVDGQSYTFGLTADTKLLPAGLADTLAIDSRVTVIAPRDVSTLGWTALGIVVHPPLP